MLIDVSIDHLLSTLEELRESEASKEDVIDTLVEYVHYHLLSQVEDDEEEDSFLEEEEELEDEYDDR